MHLESTEGKWQSHSVLTKCDECGQEYRARISTAIRQIEVVGHHQCRSCSSRRAGKKTAAKMSAIYSERWKGDGNIAKRPEVRAKVSATKTGVKFTEAHKQALRKPKTKTDLIKEAANRPEEVKRRSDRAIARVQNHTNRSNYDVGDYKTTKTPKSIYCRSGLEKKFLEYSEHISSIIKIESAEDIVIPYVKDGRDRNYLPDFKILLQDGKVFLVETKGSYFQDVLHVEECRLKEVALLDYCTKQGYGCVTLNEKEFKEWLRSLER